MLLVIASFEAAADAATETDDAMEVFLTSEVLIGPALVVLEVSDEDLIGAVAGLLDVDDNVDGDDNDDKNCVITFIALPLSCLSV